MRARARALRPPELLPIGLTLPAAWIGTVCLAVILYLAVVAGNVAARTESERLQRAEEIMSVVAASAIAATRSGEVEQIERYVQDLGRSGSLLRVCYHDLRLGLEFDSRKPAPISASRPLLSFARAALEQGQSVRQVGDDAIRLASPVRNGAETLGVIAVELVRPARLALFWSMIREETLFGGLIALCCALLSLGTARRLIRPIQQATLVADRVAAGDLSRPEPLEGSLEAHRLSASLSRMVETLRRNIEQINMMAYRDPVTELSNRADFARRGEATVRRLRNAGQGAALLFIDLDGFKEVNDTHGHDVGDAVLRLFSKRLRTAIRSTDQVVMRPADIDDEERTVDDLVARIGGDEFSVMLHHVSSREDAAVVAERILGLLRKPFSLQQVELQLSASIGIAQLSPQCASFAELLNAADAAMYDVKRSGKNDYRFAEMASAA